MVLEVILPIFTELIKDPIKHIIVSAKRHICYPFTCDSNVQKLHKQVEELTEKRSRLQISVHDAERKGDEIHPYVTKWLTSVDTAIEEAHELITSKDEAMKMRCFIGFCPNLMTRYKLSRKAYKKVSAIRNEKEPAEPISYRPAPKQITVPSVYSREDLQSRVSMLKDVMDALKDPELNMIGVYGMGGVGKTTLAKEVHRRAQTDKLFDVAVFVAVTQSPEITRIQEEIAEVLGLDLNEKGLLLRAYKLSERLKKEMNILIILDDVWNQLKLEEVGIPFGDDCKGCKILLTSRKQAVCCAMRAKKAFPIEVLSDEEAWSLFEMTVAVGEYSKLPPIATKVAKKCSGLPLLINIVASDLRNKEPSDWVDKFRQLSVLDSEEIYIKVLKVLEYSYNNLRDDELRKFFLLCGMFGQSNIRIQYLLEYSIGLGLFKHITVVKDARNRVDRLIRELKAECLLIDGDMDGFVKMHDVVRDTAISIASRIEQAFVGTSGFEVWEWPKEDCTRICLPYCDIKELPGKLEYPKAEMLLLLTEDFSLQISDLFFEGMRKLKVVDLTGMHFASLPSTLGLLANIHTLCLHRCQLDDGIAIIGELKQLEVLSFADSYIVELPREIEQLGRLKLLDLSNCSKLKVIPANVLSKLINLEELYTRKSFAQWEGINNKQKNASLGELEKLRHLTTLELEVPNPVVLQKFMLSKLPRKYWIHIGERIGYLGNESDKFSKALLFKVSNGSIIVLGHGMRAMLKEAEYLNLSGIGNWLYEMDDREGFPHLKHLVVENDEVIQQIIKCAGAFPNLEALSLRRLKSLKTICDGEVAAGSFSRLTTLKVSECDSLTNLLSIEAARCLSQLRVLEVEDCGEMEYIFVGEDNNEMVEFSQLVSLELRRLPNLKSFWKGKKQSTADPAISKDASLSLFNTTTKVSFPKLKHLLLFEINCTMIWELDHHHQHQLSNITTLTVEYCNNLKHLFGVSLINSLSHLKTLRVDRCKSMEEIILTEETESVEEEEIEEEERKLIVFPKLDYLKLKDLSKLKRFCSGYSIEFQSLKELSISSCNDLISFAVPNNNGGGAADIEVDTENSLFNHMVAFPNLEVLDVNGMSSLKYIWHSQFGDDDFFSKLKSLTISNCSKLFSIWSKNLQEVFTFEKLQSLHVLECEDLKYIFPSSIARNLPRLEKIEIAKCGVLEIIAEAECAEQSIFPFEFPQLLSVQFINLKKLTSFYRRMHVELPNLKCADVYGCHRVIKFASEHNISSGQPMFVVDKVKERLEEVTLEGNDLMMTERGEGFPFKKFSKLKVVTLMSLDDEAHHFLKRLHRLDTLVVNKGSIQVLFSEELGVGEVHVKHLELYSLHNLKHIWKWNQHSPLNPLLLHSLQTLQAQSCHSLINIAPSSSSFQNLSSLYVSDCGRLKNLVTASTAKTMVNLTQMTVHSCFKMTEIVAKDDAAEEIDLKKLKSLTLHWLPNLTCFSLAINQVFNFPSLERIIVEGCSRMITFYDGPLTTPMLRGLQTYRYGQQWQGSLNATIRSLY